MNSQTEDPGLPDKEAFAAIMESLHKISGELNSTRDSFYSVPTPDEERMKLLEDSILNLNDAVLMTLQAIYALSGYVSEGFSRE